MQSARSLWAGRVTVPTQIRVGLRGPPGPQVVRKPGAVTAGQGVGGETHRHTHGLEPEPVLLWSYMEQLGPLSGCIKSYPSGKNLFSCLFSFSFSRA